MVWFCDYSVEDSVSLFVFSCNSYSQLSLFLYICLGKPIFITVAVEVMGSMSFSFDEVAIAKPPQYYWLLVKSRGLISNISIEQEEIAVNPMLNVIVSGRAADLPYDYVSDTKALFLFMFFLVATNCLIVRSTALTFCKWVWRIADHITVNNNSDYFYTSIVYGVPGPSVIRLGRRLLSRTLTIVQEHQVTLPLPTTQSSYLIIIQTKFFVNGWFFPWTRLLSPP